MALTAPDSVTRDSDWGIEIVENYVYLQIHKDFKQFLRKSVDKDINNRI